MTSVGAACSLFVFLSVPLLVSLKSDSQVNNNKVDATMLTKAAHVYAGCMNTPNKALKTRLQVSGGSTDKQQMSGTESV